MSTTPDLIKFTKTLIEKDLGNGFTAELFLENYLNKHFFVLYYGHRICIFNDVKKVQANSLWPEFLKECNNYISQEIARRI